MPRSADALLLDMGGVVILSGVELVRRFVDRDPAAAEVDARIGRVGSAADEMWQQMQAGEVSERAYWADRARRFGEPFGEEWDTKDLMTRLFDAPPSQYVRPEALALLVDVASAGRRIGALTNDMQDFHGREWVDSQAWLRFFDVVVDASVTGVLKPESGAYKLGSEALATASDRIVFVDDQPWNVEGAQDAGMVAIRLDYDDPDAAFDLARRHLGVDGASRGGD